MIWHYLTKNPPSGCLGAKICRLIQADTNQTEWKMEDRVKSRMIHYLSSTLFAFKLDVKEVKNAHSLHRCSWIHFGTDFSFSFLRKPSYFCHGLSISLFNVRQTISSTNTFNVCIRHISYFKNHIKQYKIHKEFLVWNMKHYQYLDLYSLKKNANFCTFKNVIGWSVSLIQIQILVPTFGLFWSTYKRGKGRKGKMKWNAI